MSYFIVKTKQFPLEISKCSLGLHPKLFIRTSGFFVLCNVILTIFCYNFWQSNTADNFNLQSMLLVESSYWHLCFPGKDPAMSVLCNSSGVPVHSSRRHSLAGISCLMSGHTEGYMYSLMPGSSCKTTYTYSSDATQVGQIYLKKYL